MNAENNKDSSAGQYVRPGGRGFGVLHSDEPIAKKPLLVQACIDKNIDTIKDILKTGVSTKIKNDALYYACTNLDIPAIKLLLENGADPNSTQCKGYHRGSIFSRLLIGENQRVPPVSEIKKAVKLLLEAGADINATNYFNRSFLFKVCSFSREIKDNVELIKFLIENGADVNNVDHLGYSVLSTTSGDCEKIQLTKLLLEHGANIHVESRFGNTALSRSIGGINIEAVKLILVHETEPDNINRALEHARYIKEYYKKHPERNLYKYKKKNTQPRIKQTTDIVNVIKEYMNNIGLTYSDTDIKLLETPTPIKEIDMLDDNNMTKLMKACKNKDIKLIQDLLDTGADVNLKNTNKLSALYYACSNMNVEIIELLLKNGADPNIKDKATKTNIFSRLLISPSQDVQPIKQVKKALELLVQHGANINTKGHKGKTFLYRLCEFKQNIKYNTELAEFIIENGADVNVIDSENVSILKMISDNAEKTELMKLLLKNYACPDIKNGHKWNARKPKYSDTALTIACSSNNIQAVKLLLEYGADINAVNEKRNSSIDIVKHNIENYREERDSTLSTGDKMQYKENIKTAKRILNILAEHISNQKTIEENFYEIT